MRIPIWLTVISAIAGLALVIVVAQALMNPDLPLIVDAGFSLETISPNADGSDDITTLTYTISRNALVSIVLEANDSDSDAPDQFVFRDHQLRVAGDYRVDFSGVVDGYTMPGEDIAGVVERRLIPDGAYTWRITAEDPETGEVLEKTGTLTVRDADVPLPIISSFTTSTDVFTPNQDGISDRVEISIYLEKEAVLNVYLIDENDNRYPISARQEGRLPGQRGRHIFDYEGGVDLGSEPPPNGSYTIVALAQDAEGQRIRHETALRIELGGKPRAEIVPQDVGVDVIFAVQPYADRFYSDNETQGDFVGKPDDPANRGFAPITMQVGDMLVFMLTVENYSATPIRTSGPMPGTVYQQSQLPAAQGYMDESGVWRVGIECQTSKTTFPYRWAVGSEDDLIAIEDPTTGESHLYLPPGEAAVVWGAVRLTDIEDRNPQQCWAGLIHEDVAISAGNNNVGRREITLVDPSGSSQNEE